MNHLCARERHNTKVTPPEPLGVWDFTNENDGRFRRLGYCIGPETRDRIAERMKADGGVHNDQELARWALHAEKFHNDGHTTQEDAEACYTGYVLDQRVRYHREDSANVKSVHRCIAVTTPAKGKTKAKTCDAFTADFVHIVGSAGSHFRICRDHHTREHVAEAMGPISQIWSS